MTKVSIIIPFHNAGKYLSKCLSSIIYQSIEDIEIICINDASDDDSKEIAQHFAAADKRVILLNTGVLSGQSYARNLGMDAASGKYTGFVDADDWVSLDMFEKLYNKAEQDNADITMCQASLYDDTMQEFSENSYYNLKSFERFGNTAFNAADAKDDILNNTAVVWNKIYNSDFLARSGIKFQEGYIYEDLPFAAETFLKAEKINIVWEKLYFYRQNRRFSTMQNSDKKVYDRIPMVLLSYNILKKAEFFNEKKAEIISWIIDDIFHRFTLLEDKYYQDYYSRMKEFFIQINNTMTDEDRIILAEKSYCRDEFDCIVNGTYLDFWKFLIEKYKTANKKIKEAEHKCNLDIKAVKDYLEQYKKEQDKEKAQIIQWWEKNTEEKVREALKTCAGDFQKKMDEQFNYMQSKKEEEMKKLYEDMKAEQLRQEYDLKAWQAQSVKQVQEQLEADYKWKIKELENHYQESLILQKNYYENHYLLIKILFKIYKKAGQLRNKAGMLLKKN